MKETNLSESLLNWFIDTNDSEVKKKFMSYTAMTENGRAKDIRTPFYNWDAGKEDDDNVPRSEVLSKWMPQLASLEKQMPGLYQYEMDQAEKVGPLSVQKPLNERLDSIQEYYDGITLPSQPISTAAFNAVTKFFSPLNGLRVRAQTKVLEDMDLSKAAGAPYLGKKRDRVSLTVPCVTKCFASEISNASQAEGFMCYQWLADGSDWNSTALLGWRGQEHGPEKDDVKQRVIWMMSFADSISELQMYQPLIQGAQKFNLMPPWIGESAVDEAMTRLLIRKAPDQLVLCTDFTAFDQHFGPVMQSMAYSIIEALSSTGDKATSDWLHDVFWTKYYIPLIAGNKIYTGRHGMASGSGGTNCDESLAHRALQFEAALNDGATLHPDSMAQGDDGVLTYPGICKEAVTEYYSSHGLEMNVEKQEESERQAIFLRRWYDREYTQNDGICRGVYPTTRAIGRLVGMERTYDHWDSTLITLRYLSIIENCKWHPKFNEFVEFCIRGDKYRLGLDIPGFYSHIRQIAREAMEFMPSFMSYNQAQNYKTSDFRRGSGIEEWKVVQYILKNYTPVENRKIII